MSRMLAAGMATLLLVAAGLFWWQGRAAQVAAPAPMVAPAPPPQVEALPEGDPDAVGAAPPMPGAASARTREEKRFDRYDRNRDGVITRIEMLGSRTKAFKALDTNGDNLLSFEEWAVATSDRFASADGDKDGKLTREEFAATAPKRSAKPKCKC